MKFLVKTPFRCGSSFLVDFLKKNTLCPVFFSRQKKLVATEEKFIVKSHQHDDSHLIQYGLDYVFTIIRKPTEIFISTFMKDLKTKGYPYFFEGDVSEQNLDIIVNYFLSFDWTNFKWCSYDDNFNQIKDLTGIDIWKEPFDKTKGIQLYNSSPKLIVITHRTLFDDNLYDNFKNFILSEFNFSLLTRGTFSYKNDDTYGDLYSKFKEKIPKSFFEKYKEIDNKICQKFLIDVNVV